MDKRYQVFVSSTYQDLQDERREVIQALLELDCIPAGMELFAANNDDQWTYITRVIDKCDYYLLIIGGRYGSTCDDGMSYTEKEYRYAVQQGIPVVAFLHADPADIRSGKCEADDAKKQRLGEFRDLVQKKMCKQWRNAAELGAVVSRSITQLVKNHPATGWVRADQATSPEALNEILRLQKENEELRTRCAMLATDPPPGSERFAQGEQRYEISYTAKIVPLYEDQAAPGYDRMKLTRCLAPSWNTLFGQLGPLLVVERRQDYLRSSFLEFAKRLASQDATEYVTR